MGTSFGIGDDVLVMQEATSDDKSGLPSELKGRWVGRILEIRATSGANVHVLINWYNRPEDLPKRREAYHSMNEVLATNDVDIIAPSEPYEPFLDNLGVDRANLDFSISGRKNGRESLGRIGRNSAT